MYIHKMLVCTGTFFHILAYAFLFIKETLRTLINYLHTLIKLYYEINSRFSNYIPYAA